MEEDLISAEEFFEELGKQEQTPLVRVTDHKVRSKGLEAFEDVKVKMVMRIEGCGREEAARIIAARAEELRRLRNASAT